MNALATLQSWMTADHFFRSIISETDEKFDYSFGGTIFLLALSFEGCVFHAILRKVMLFLHIYLTITSASVLGYSQSKMRLLRKWAARSTVKFDSATHVLSTIEREMILGRVFWCYSVVLGLFWSAYRVPEGAQKRYVVEGNWSWCRLDAFGRFVMIRHGALIVQRVCFGSKNPERSRFYCVLVFRCMNAFRGSRVYGFSLAKWWQKGARITIQRYFVLQILLGSFV